LLGAYKALAKGADSNAGVSISNPSNPNSDDTMNALHWAAKSKQLVTVALPMIIS